MRQMLPCVSGQHRGHWSPTLARACAEDAERLRRINEQQGEDAFDAEDDDDDG